MRRRVRRVGLDLLAQAPDVDGHRRGVAVAVAPHVLEDLLAAERLARVAHEEREQLELPGGQRHHVAVPAGLAGGDVDLEVAVDVDGAVAPGRRRRSGPRARRSTARTRATSSLVENGLAT